MSTRKLLNRYPWLRQAGTFLVLAILFSFAYTQSPLYTSNQNQYFLHGLAQAGLGDLNQDWLANTLDPTPVFSALVYFTYKYLHQPVLFYIYYAALMGIYLFCLVGIARQVSPLDRSPARRWLFVALVFLVHSALLRFSLSRLIGDNWAYLLEDGLADQRLLGPVFQPSTFGVLLVLSVYLFLQRRPFLAVAAAALAATVHPTYLLSAGALALAYMIMLYQEQRSLKPPLLLGLAAVLLVAPIVIYVYQSFGGAVTPAAAKKAQDILVDFRIPHHAVVGRWFDLTAVLKIGAVLAALWLVRRHRLFLILLVPSAAALLLTLAQLLLDSSTLALLFPWRVSTFLVPISIAILLAWAVCRMFDRWPTLEGRRQAAVKAASLGVIVVLVIGGLFRINFERSRQANAPDRPLMAFVAANRQPGEVYLTPIEMQDFRLAAGASAFVEFKSIPYRDFDVLEWQERIRITEHFYAKGQCSTLEKLAYYGVTHVVAGPNQATIDCAEWQEIYRDPVYRIYRIN